MRLKTFAALALAVFVTGGLAASHPASAITLIPPSLEFNAKPGDVIPTKVKLFNETTTAAELFSSTANFKAKDETGTPEFLTTATPEDLASWITIGPGPFVLQPGERIEIPVDITVPATADPGGHFAGILFSAQDPKTTGQGTQVTISSKIGTLILVRVAGEIREAAAISSFTIDAGRTDFNRLPVDFSIRVSNTGNVHVRPTGSITIRNLLGGTSIVLPVNTAQGAVLPASIRKFTAAWEKSTPTGKTNFFKEFANEWDNFALGPYTANLTLTYGQSNEKSLNAMVKFYVFPWRVLLLGLILILFIVWLIIFSVKRYNRWIIKQAESKLKPTPKK